MAASSISPARRRLEYVVLSTYEGIEGLPLYTLASTPAEAAAKAERYAGSHLQQGLRIHRVPWERKAFWRLMETGPEPMAISTMPPLDYDHDWHRGAFG